MSLTGNITKKVIMGQLLSMIVNLRREGKSADEILLNVEAWAMEGKAAAVSGWD